MREIRLSGSEGGGNGTTRSSLSLSPRILGDGLSKDWIPGFAGMTGVGLFSTEQEPNCKKR